MHDGGRKLGLARNQTLSGSWEFPARLWSILGKQARNLIFPPVKMKFTDNLPDDASVIHNTLKGDINSFEILIDRYQDHVSRIISNHVPREEAPEVAHETFVKAYQSLGGFKGTGPFKHWLSKIAIRCCHDFWRSYYQKPENLAGPLPDDCRDWVAHLLSDQSAEREAERAEARDLLQWALGQLSAADRTVLTLTHLNEYSVAEAAELLEWSVIRTKVQSHRARKKLRKILAKILPEGMA
jgi:RNA polymerase sigma-70 factor (ECF subfamily)